MGIFDKIKGCQVIKESLISESEINELKEILETCPESEKSKIEQAIRNLEYGIKGENAILFELKNSGFPMLVLHDLYLEYEDLSAQIDFLIITRGKNYIIESKNMYGDVSVTDSGDFYRKIHNKTQKIYSPITQCDRHVELILQIRYREKTNFLAKAMFEKNARKNYIPLVVMANPTGKISTRYAPKDVKNKIISVDQLVRHIKKNHNPKDENLEKDMVALGDFFLNAHKENPQNYMEQYRKLKNSHLDGVEDQNKEVLEINNADTEKIINDTVPDVNGVDTEINKDGTIMCTRCGSAMVLRVAKKGENEGKEFYGCSNFPKCRKIIYMDEL